MLGLGSQRQAVAGSRHMLISQIEDPQLVTAWKHHLESLLCGACWPEEVMVGQEQRPCTCLFSVQVQIICL